MRRLLLLPLAIMTSCSDEGSLLSVSILPSQTVLQDSRPLQGVYRSAFLGRDGEATLFWPRVQDDDSLVVHGQSISSDLESGERLAVSGEGRSATYAAACRHEHGFAIAWHDTPVKLPRGITLNESDVAATMNWPAASDSLIVNPNQIGRQAPSSMVCLAGGERVVAWSNVCVAVNYTGSYYLYFAPEECDTEPVSGSYLQFLAEDGTTVSGPVRVDGSAFSPTLMASTVGDEFVTLTGTKLQSWRGHELVDQEDAVDAWSMDAALVCVRSQCAAATDGQLLLFDAADLSSSRLVVFQESSQPAPNQVTYARDTHLACDPDGVCVVTWVVDHEVSYEDVVETTTLGVYMAAFDLRTATFGETVLVREPTRDEFGALVAATGPGQFLLASVLDADIVVQRLITD